ncbi:MAG: ATP-dependent Clp protease proteolytic subunit [Bacteroidaceae bacterium]|nr:ATP-dependent Clp protease proteolytic subunit [Bacteroidaceae bacterium]
MKYDIYINDNIGWPISAGYVRDRLAKFKDKPVTVYLHSLGGSVSDALDIYQQLRDHGQVTVAVFGMTASAATILACGAKRILMSDKALLLIHRSSNWASEWGRMNAEDITAAIRRLRQSRDMLEKIDAIIANIYAQRSGGRAEDFAATMQEELWLTAAKEMGLVDEIIDEGEAPDDRTLQTATLQACALPDIPAAGTAGSGLSDDAGTAGANVPDGDSEAGDTAAPKPAENALRTAVRRIISSLRREEAAAEDTDHQHTNNDMSKNNQSLGALCALLAVATMAAGEDGSVSLTKEQAAAVDKALGRIDALEQEVKDLKAERDELRRQVTDLKAADGDETGHVEGDDTPDDGDDDKAGSRVRDNYDKLKGIL